jgi:monoamine oxidase
MKKPEILILGGGLSGLVTAYELSKSGFSSNILEARTRLGGRIYTLRPYDKASIEMGATWLGKQHCHLCALLDELNVSITEQYMGPTGFYEPMSVSPPQLVELPPNQEPSYRIDGGTDTIIKMLADHLEKDTLHLDEPVQEIERLDDRLVIQTEQNRFMADYVISTLPPKLLADSITFTPALPDALIQIASNTHTWMAESIKVALTFDTPFWRQANSSGTIFSNVGPVNEMYDHSSESFYALKGFMNGAYYAESPDKRKNLIIKQLHRFYRDRVESYLSYHDLAWKNEPYTFSDYQDTVIPHLNNGHKIYQNPFFDGRLILAGADTATHFPGYMDGAVESALNAVKTLREQVLKA